MMNWLRKLVGLGGTAKNLTSLNEEDCKKEIKSFAEKTNLNLFQGYVQNLYSTQRIKQTAICPRCEAETEKKAATFVCATDTIPQIIISTENHFCTNCSSALIDDKLLQKTCEKGKVYRGIIGFYIRENIQTYQSLNEYIIRYHYDQNSKPSGIKITGEKIAEYDPKIHGSKGTKNQHKIPSSPVTLMDRVERRDKRESLNPLISSTRNNQGNSSTDQNNQGTNDKAARSERARLAMENAKKKVRSKHKAKEEFTDSVQETKQNFKDKVERKSNFTPKKRQKPVVENPNEKKSAQQELQVEEKQQETKNLSFTKKQTPPARASQRKKQISNIDKKEEETIQSVDKKYEEIEVNQDIIEAKEENNAGVKKNRRYKHKRSNRKSRNNKRPTRTPVEAQQEEPKNDETKKSQIKKEKEIAQQEQNKISKQNENKEQIQKENVIEKLHQNLQESSKTSSILPKEEKQKESSRLARLKEENKEEKVSRRRPRSNVRPPIDLDLKNVNPRRRYNNTKKK